MSSSERRAEGDPEGLCSEQAGCRFLSGPTSTPAPREQSPPPETEPGEVGAQWHQAGMAESTPSELPGQQLPGCLKSTGSTPLLRMRLDGLCRPNPSPKGTSFLFFF